MEAAMAFDFKKEYKEFYMAKNKPEIVEVPKANYIAVRGKGDPNEKEDLDWAKETASKKKKIDCSLVEFLTIDEGLCVQIMHIGLFDDEPKSVALMEKYLQEKGYVNDMNKERLHHEIYMSDARKIQPEKWKTVIRHPIKKI